MSAMENVTAAIAAGGGKVDEFVRVIHLSGDLDDDQRARLLEIADKCPVHHTLQAQAVIRTRLAEDQPVV